MTTTWPGHLHEKIMTATTTTGQMQRETSRICFHLVSLVHCAANAQPGFGTETRKSADMTEIGRPFQQQQNLSHQPACAAPLQSYIPVSCKCFRCLNMQDTFPEAP